MYISNQLKMAMALDALKTARETIKALHGEIEWDIYSKHSPEMKKVNQAIELLAKGKIEMS